MDNSKIVFLINNSARAVMGVYEPGQTPTMFKTLDAGLSVGDFAVVQSDTRHKLTTVKITAIDVDVNFDSAIPLNWVIQAVDMKSFDALLQSEAQAIAKVQEVQLRKKREELKAALFADQAGMISALALSKSEDADELL